MRKLVAAQLLSSARMKFIQVELFLSVLLILISKGYSIKLGQPDFIAPLRNLTVEVRRNATFECFVTGIEKYRVGWIKADTKAIQAIGKHVISNNPRISVSHDETRTKFRLHITEVTLEDAGPYMCQINSMPVRKQSGYLTVIQPSDITKITGDKVVNEGGIVKLTCEAEGYPPPNIYWTREQRDEMITIWMNGRKLQVDRVENRTLELRKVTRSQMGSYLCIATNGYPPAVSKKVHVNVNFRPVITVAEPRIVTRPGEDVSLECVFEFHPRGLIWWERESGEILSRNEKYSVADYILNEFTVRSRLMIKNFHATDVGRYTCVGRNVFNKEGDREQGHIFVTFAKIQETTTEKWTTSYEEKPVQRYEYTVPDQYHQTIEANTGPSTTKFNYDHNFHRQFDQEMDEEDQEFFHQQTKDERSSSRHYYFNNGCIISLLSKFNLLMISLLFHL